MEGGYIAAASAAAEMNSDRDKRKVIALTFSLTGSRGRRGRSKSRICGLSNLTD